MEIRRVLPGDRDAVRQAHAIVETVRAADTPELAPVSEDMYAGALEHPPPHSETRCYTAAEDGAFRGHLWIYLPLKDNTHYIEAELAVHPDHRRRGIGTALLDRLLRIAAEEERSELVVMAHVAVEGGPDRSDAGPKFLERHGFTAALTEIDRRLELADLDRDAETRLWDASIGAADDYELVSWTGRTPEQYLEGLGRIDSQIFAEIPLGDVDLRPRVLDADYVRAREDKTIAQGHNMVRTIAVHKETGEVAANTLIYVHGDEEHAGQAITIVDPAHRGHRLGLLAKLANHRQLREQFGHITTVWTGNADTNANMNAINHQLGFRPVDARVSYKRRLDQ